MQKEQIAHWPPTLWDLKVHTVRLRAAKSFSSLCLRAKTKQELGSLS